jgi:hypothetical protein
MSAAMSAVDRALATSDFAELRSRLELALSRVQKNRDGDY